MRSFTALIWLTVAALAFAENTDWPQFRGSNATGQTNGNVPDSWDTAKDKNIAWKAELPGKGPASPIVVGDRVFVTASGGREQSELYTLAFDAKSGKQIWKRTLYATGRTLTHETSANAAPTPASDGKHVVAFYSSNDLACYDLDGNLKWFRGLASDYPKLGNDIGMASSPTIIGDVVVIQAESQGDSFAMGINMKDGTTRWKADRPRDASWATPTAMRVDSSNPLVLLQSGEFITAIDVKSGEEVWRHDASCDTIPSPLAVGEDVFIASDGLTKLAIDEDETDVDWQSGKLATGSSSPIFKDGKIYTVNRSGVLTCADSDSGDVAWQLRLKIGRQWATPAIAGERIVCIDNSGKAAVVDISGEEGKVLSNPEMGEPVQASPAIAGNAIFFRSDAHLWKIEKSN